MTSKQIAHTEAQLAAALANAGKKIEQAGAEIEGLVAQLRAARGTKRDVGGQSIVARVEAALAGEVRTPIEIAAELGLTEAQVRDAARRLGDRVADIGEPGEPLLVLVIGDETTNEELADIVEKMLRTRGKARPMSRQELLAATGARENRVSGAFVRMQRHGVPVVNAGTANRALWYVRRTAR